MVLRALTCRGYMMMMCLLIVLSRCHEVAPLIVAANRDEWLARPAAACAVVQDRDPRIVGGRDELAGGTWLAVNEHGVFAGLTNRPAPARNPARRSRGELPLALTRHQSARDAARDFVDRFHPVDYGPAWLMVGDRSALFLLDMTGGQAPGVEELPPGVHVLENRAWGAPSAKVAAVRARLRDVQSLNALALHRHLLDTLRAHDAPDGPGDDSGVPGFTRPRETEANCVHAGPYGTRSASIVLVPGPPGLPRIWCSDGPPCTHELVERTSLFTDR